MKAPWSLLLLESGNAHLLEMGGAFLRVNYEPVIVSPAQQPKEHKTVCFTAFSIHFRAAC